jgi:vesicle coat complex subunit
MTEKQMEEMVENNPRAYLDILKSGSMNPTDLTFALEILGLISEEYYEEALEILEQGLEHPKAYVREGALYGLGSIARMYDEAWEIIDNHKDEDEDLNILKNDILSWSDVKA